MKKWNREETIVAFNVYCKIPFQSSSKNNPTVIQYAKILDRSPSALSMKIGNIGRLDPDLQAKGIVGLSHGAKLEEEIWKEFYEDPEGFIYESEKLISLFSKQSIEVSAEIETDDLPKGIERETIVRRRINQSFFRMAVISSYNYRCCISGVGNKELLEACHIVDWVQDADNRTNPKNGLCMNSFFHKAYDKYLLGITPDLKIIISEELMQSTNEPLFKKYLAELNGKNIALPYRFFPKRDLLEIHYEKFKSQ